MEPLEFWKLSQGNYEMGEIRPFCLRSFGNMTCLTGSALNIYKFIPMSCFSIRKSVLPYVATPIPIPDSRPFSKLFENIDFRIIYASGNIQECQELALDAVYVSDCSRQPPTARALHAELVPNYPEQDLELCTVLTNYGELAMLYRNMYTGDWESLDTNLSTILIPETISQTISSKNIKHFTQLRTFTQQYRICYFCWDKTYPIMYLTTAAGCIIILSYDMALKQFKNLNTLETEIGEIVYLMNFENFLFASSRQGSIHLYRIDRDGNELKHSECLYSNSDGMTCQRALMQYNAEHDVYTMIFAKSAHLMIFCLSKEGKILSNAVQYINGIKITGIEILGLNEFVITTIVGHIKQIRVLYNANDANDNLKIEEYNIKHTIDVMNFQILGICSLGKGYLWSVVLCRNKTIHHMSKWSRNAACVVICRLNNLNVIAELEKYMRNDNLDDCYDLLLTICLDIKNCIHVNAYASFLDLEKIHYTNNLSNDVLNRMRIKYFLGKQIMSHNRFKIAERDFCIKDTIHFLKNALQMIHIAERLKYLKTLELQTLTDFQQLAINCMQIKYFEFLIDLKNLNENNTPLKQIVSNFLTFIEGMEVYHFLLDDMVFDLDQCMLCDEILTLSDFDTCKNGHVIRRCSVSYVQLRFSEWRYCPQCNAIALPKYETKPSTDETPLESSEIKQADAKTKTTSSNFRLEDLFPSNEQISCIFCNFLLKQDS